MRSGALPDALQAQGARNFHEHGKAQLRQERVAEIALDAGEYEVRVCDDALHQQAAGLFPGAGRGIHAVGEEQILVVDEVIAHRLRKRAADGALARAVQPAKQDAVAHAALLRFGR